MTSQRWKIIEGDLRRPVLIDVGSEPFDAVLCDPPYELGFMGKKWDASGVAFSVKTWQWVFQQLRPGAPLIAFGGTRTYHRMTCAIEDSGFEIRDCLMWLYGCLSDDTEILVDGEWVPYHKATAGRLALCYNADDDSLSWQPIQQLFIYRVSDTAYHIQSDSTDQIVSRGHRCLVERDGAYVFRIAEDAAREREARVPVLEDVYSLLAAIPMPHQGTGNAQQGMPGVLAVHATSATQKVTAGPAARTGSPDVPVWQGVLAGTSERVSVQSGALLPQMQRGGSRARVEGTCAQGSCRVEAGIGGGARATHDGIDESGLEGRCHVPQTARPVWLDEVCSVSAAVRGDGAQGRLRDGASVGCGAGDGPVADALGIGAPYRSQSDEQHASEFDAVSYESRSQTVRASRFARADLARIEPVQYDGIIWCVRTPTSAFVARRNGKAFITGNSGFPKSLDISKAIDKDNGHWRGRAGAVEGHSVAMSGPRYARTEKGEPITAAAAAWDGWGTALKPAWEPAMLAQKPLDGSYAENALKHGVGGLDIDGTRVAFANEADKAAMSVGVEAIRTRGGVIKGSWKNSSDLSGANPVSDKGRWPANVVLDKEAATQLDEQSGNRPGMSGGGKHRDDYEGGMFGGIDSTSTARGDNGGASRFFYTAKVSTSERNDGLDDLPVLPASVVTGRGSKSYDECGVDQHASRAGRTGTARNSHPTLKPVALTEYLAKLILPPRIKGRTRRLLVPFSGAASEMIGALRAGWDEVVGIEQSPEYAKIARLRLERMDTAWRSSPQDARKKPR